MEEGLVDEHAAGDAGVGEVVLTIDGPDLPLELADVAGLARVGGIGEGHASDFRTCGPEGLGDEVAVTLQTIVDGVALGVEDGVAVLHRLDDAGGVEDGVAVLVADCLVVLVEVDVGGLLIAPRLGGVDHTEGLVVGIIRVDVDVDGGVAVGLAFRVVRLDGVTVLVHHDVPIGIAGEGRGGVRDAVAGVGDAGGGAGVEADGAPGGGVGGGGVVVGADVQAGEVVRLLADDLGTDGDDPLDVGDPLTGGDAVLVDLVADGGVEGVVAAADAHLGGEVVGLDGEGAVGAATGGGAVTVDVVNPADGGEAVAFGDGHGAALDHGAGVVGVAEGVQDPAIRHAILVVVAEAGGIGALRRGDRAVDGVTGVIFGDEDDAEGDVLPIGGSVALTATGALLDTVDGDGVLVLVALGDNGGGATAGGGLIVVLPPIEEGVLGAAQRGRGEVVHAVEAGVAGPEGEGLEGGGGDAVPGQGGEGEVLAPAPLVIAIGGGELDVAEAGERGRVEDVEAEGLGGFQRDHAIGVGLGAAGVDDGEEPAGGGAGGIGVGEGDLLGTGGGAVEDVVLFQLVLLHQGRTTGRPSVRAHDGLHLVFIDVELRVGVVVTIREAGNEVVGGDVIDGEVPRGGLVDGGVVGTVSTADGGGTVLGGDFQHGAVVILTGDVAVAVAGLGNQDRGVGDGDGGAITIALGGGAAHVVGGEVVDQGDHEGAGGGVGIHAHHIIGIGGGADGGGALDTDVFRDDVEGLATIGIGEGVVDADVVAVGVLADGIDHHVAGILGGLVEGEGVGEIVERRGGVVTLDRRERGVVFLAGVGGAGDGDVFAVGGGVDLEVEGHIDGAGAVGQGFQLRHPDTEEDRLAGGDVIGNREGGVGGGGAGDVDGDVVAIGGDAEGVRGEGLNDGVERGVVRNDVGVLSDGDGEGVAGAGDDDAGVAGTAVDGDAIQARRGGAPGEGDVAVAIEGGVADGIAQVGGAVSDERGRREGVFPPRIGGLGGVVGGRDAVAEANLTIGRIGVVARDVEEELLLGEGGGGGAADGGGVRIIKGSGEGGGDIALLDLRVVAGHRGDAGGNLLPGGSGGVVVFDPEAAGGGELGGGEGGDSGAIGRGEGGRVDALVENAFIIGSDIADGEGVTVDGDIGIGVTRVVLRLIGRIAGEGENRGGEALVGGNRAGRDHGEGETVDVVAEDGLIVPIDGVGQVGGEVAGTDHIDEAHGQRVIADRALVEGDGGVGRLRLGLVRFQGDAVLQAGPLEVHVQLEVRPLARGRQVRVEAVPRDVEGTGVRELDIEVNPVTHGERLRGVPTGRTHGDTLDVNSGQALGIGLAHAKESQDCADGDQEGLFDFHTVLPRGEGSLKGVNGPKGPAGCPWPRRGPAG